MSDLSGEGANNAKLTLPAMLDLKAAPDLKQALEAAAWGQEPLQVDASEVQRVSSLCLQLLAASRKTFASGPGFAIIGASKPFIEAVNGLGLADALGLAGESNG